MKVIECFPKYFVSCGKNLLGCKNLNELIQHVHFLQEHKELYIFRRDAEKLILTNMYEIAKAEEAAAKKNKN